MANIELPKDAEGREIPLDTEVLYRKDGTLADVDEFNFSTGYSDPEHKWTVRLMNCAVFFTTKMFLNPPEPPDSWEKLEEDLDRGIQADSLCMYHSTKRVCKECPINSEGICHNAAITLKDIKRRIRSLLGEN